MDPVVANETAEASENVLSVLELTRAIKRTLEEDFSGVWVEGELFTFKRHSSGHLYFTLKDEGAQLAAVMFRGAAQRLRFNPGDGLRVQCRGRITVYEPQGKYQLLVEEMRPAGAGALLAALEKLKARLSAEGLFDPARKIPLPFLPRRVGIVTSPTGAAIRDMLRILHDRFPVPVLLVPAAVQGREAAAQIAAGIRALDLVDDVDVIIVGRGGGSLEDLWAFNEEIVVRAVADCRTPIVSAVGHEVDVMLSDFAADVRAPTPTGAAEMVVPRKSDLQAALADAVGRMRRAISRRLVTSRAELRHLALRLPHPSRQIEARALRQDELVRRLEAAMERYLQKRRMRLTRVSDSLRLLHPKRRLAENRRVLEALSRRLEPAMRRQLERSASRLERSRDRLSALGPTAVLERGYAIVRMRGKASVIRSWRDVRKGAIVDVLLAEGAFSATVDGRGPSRDTLAPAETPPPAPPGSTQGKLFDP
jgi:exodeoxyribonuclease VII large subunit